MAIGFKSASATPFNNVLQGNVSVGVAVGDVLVVGVAVISDQALPVASMTDQLGNAFARVGTGYNGTVGLDLWIADPVGFAGTSTITIALNGSATQMVVLTFNMSGVLSAEGDLEGQTGSGTVADCNLNGQPFSSDAGTHFLEGFVAAGGNGTFSSNTGTLRASSATSFGSNDVGGAVGNATGNPAAVAGLKFTVSKVEDWTSSFQTAFGGIPPFTADLFFNKERGPGPVVLVTKTVREFRVG